MSGPKTLSSAHPNTTLSGSILGVALADNIGGAAYYAAVYGPSKTNFTVTNNATIQAVGGSFQDTGILLAAAGTVVNTATIESNIGILLQSTAAGEVVKNKGFIATNSGNYGGSAIELRGAGSVSNSGIIEASVKYGAAALSLGAGGYGGNSGYISGWTGIAMDGSPSDLVYNSGTIEAVENGISLGAGGTAANTGRIIGDDTGRTPLNGIAINGGFGTAANDGTITGFFAGIGIGFLGGDAFNLGTIYADTGISMYGVGYALNEGKIVSDGSGIYLESQGYVTNAGLIQANGPGVFMAAGGSLTNYGVINSLAYAVQTSGGDITNQSQITGYNGIFATGSVNISNLMGSIIDGTLADGIELDVGGGLVVNNGDIIGNKIGVQVIEGGTVDDTGTITGGTFAIAFAKGYANRLVIDAGSVIQGSIQGGGGVLEFAPDGKIIGTFSTAMEKQFADFGNLQIDAGAVWDFGGKQTLSAPILNNGTIKETAKDTLTIDAALTGAGLVDISKNALTLNGSVASGEKIAFGGTNETLDLGDPIAFKGKIEKFKTSDTIDLTSVKLTDIVGTSFAKSVLTIITNTETLHLTFADPGVFGTDTFQLFADGTGTGITLAPPAALSGLLPHHLATSGTTLAPLVTFSA